MITNTSSIIDPKITNRHISKKLKQLEIILVSFSLIIIYISATLVKINTENQSKDNFYFLLNIYFISIIFLIISTRIYAPLSNPFLIPITFLLNGIGIIEIYRIDIEIGLNNWEATSTRQIIWASISIITASIIIYIFKSHKFFLKYTYLIGFLSFFLLILPLLPIIGHTEGGAQVWINIGELSFQPGEIGKITLTIFFAGYLMKTKDSLSLVGKKIWKFNFPRLKDLGPLLILWFLSMSILIFQRDLGTSLLYFGIFLIMLYAATARISWVFLGTLLFILGAFFASIIFNYVNKRFQNWINPFDPERYDESYQLLQGLFGLAHGGIIGKGLGNGNPSITPKSQSDYIVASIGEELGLSGVFVILSLYLILFYIGMKIALGLNDDFGKLLSIGLSFLIALQVFIVIGGVTRAIPLTGLTTPFLSAGGSSLLANWIIIAIFLRLSDAIRKQVKVVL